jgi:uncharacterized protein (TIGR02246 family)
VSTDQDEAAIRRIIADVQAAFNTNDADLMTEHFAKDATAVTAMGERVTGWDALLAANREGLAGFLRDQYARYDVTDVRFLRPDVALAYKEARATTSTGDLIDLDHTMVALYVLVKDNDRWRIAARQNTLAPR